MDPDLPSAETIQNSPPYPLPSHDLTHSGAFHASDTITKLANAGNNVVWVATVHGRIHAQDSAGTHIDLAPGINAIGMPNNAEVSSMTRVGPTMWIGATDSVVRVYTIETAMHIIDIAIRGGVPWCMCTGSDHSVVHVGCGDGTICDYDVATYNLVGEYMGHTAAVRSLCVADDVRCLVSGSEDGTVRIWGRDDRVLRSCLTEHSKSVLCVIYVSPNIWSSSISGTIRIWDIASGKCTGTLRQHQSAVPLLMHNPGDSKVWSMGHDGCVYTWHARTFHPLQELPRQDNPITIAHSFGKVVAWRVWTCTSEGVVNTWLSISDRAASSATNSETVCKHTAQSEVTQVVSSSTATQTEVILTSPQHADGGSFSKFQVQEFLRDKKAQWISKVRELEDALLQSQTECASLKKAYDTLCSSSRGLNASPIKEIVDSESRKPESSLVVETLRKELNELHQQLLSERTKHEAQVTAKEAETVKNMHDLYTHLLLTVQPCSHSRSEDVKEQQDKAITFQDVEILYKLNRERAAHVSGLEQTVLAQQKEIQELYRSGLNRQLCDLTDTSAVIKLCEENNLLKRAIELVAGNTHWKSVVKDYEGEVRYWKERCRLTDMEVLALRQELSGALSKVHEVQKEYIRVQDYWSKQCPPVVLPT